MPSSFEHQVHKNIIHTTKTLLTSSIPAYTLKLNYSFLIIFGKLTDNVLRERKSMTQQTLG